MHLENPNAGRKKKALCISCARNKHKLCDLHMNDGAVDAEEFISVRCDCFCAGRIGTQFDSLMSMAEHYAEQVKQFADETRQAKMLAARAAGVADEVMEIVRAFDSRARDDEGNLMVASRREHVDRVLDDFFLQMKAVASKSEAVLALIAENNGFPAKELIDKLFERTDEDERAAEIKARLPWERGSHSMECVARNYYGCECEKQSDDFDGPIGDGPQGPMHDPEKRKWVVTEPGGKVRDVTPDEGVMIAQHIQAQAVIAQQRAAAAAENTGWPID